jgi:hypothetical protein
MNRQLPDTEALLEIGFAVSGALLLGGLGVLALGRAVEHAGRERRHRAAPPARGSVPAHRHHNVVANSPR